MSKSALIARLETVADLRDADRQRLAALCNDVRTLAAKESILGEGDRPEHLHLIAAGWAARYKILPEGSRQIVGLLIPGDFCDLHVTILGHMDHGIVALTECEVCYIPANQIDELTAAHNGLTKALWWSTLVDEAVLRSWVVNAGRRTAHARVAHLMCEMHSRLSMVGLVEDDRLAWPMTQEELADATALTPVHINRTLQRLRAEGLIELGGGVLTVLDLAALQSVAGFDPAYLHIRRQAPATTH